MLLIHPPIAKPCEPPAGVAMLAGALKAHDIPYTVIDANIEGIEFLINQPLAADDTWSKRAKKHAATHLDALRGDALYRNPARYQRSVADLNRVLSKTGQPHHVTLNLGNYQDQQLSAVSSQDLLRAAEQPEQNLFYRYFSQRIDQAMVDHQPRFVGFSLNYLSQALPTFAMIGYLKQHYPQCTIIVGGGLITSWMRSPRWNAPFDAVIDHCIDGPGEQPLLRILTAQVIAATQPHGSRLSDCPNLPDYSNLPMHRYLAPGLILPYATSRGCYWNRCSFCPEHAENNRYSALSPTQVVNELHQLSEGWQPRLIHLLDNALSPALLSELTHRRLAAPWYGFARISQQLTNLDFCLALKKSGCVMLKLGVESGDQQVLDAMEKGVSIELTARVLSTLQQAGIATYVYLLFGTPTENHQRAEKTLAFVRKHHEAITFVNLAIFNLPLNSPEAKQLALREFYSGDLSLYSDFDHPLGWNRGKIRRFLEQEFKRDPHVAAMLRRDPPLFTSNHAPFFWALFRFVWVKSE